ncbi:hypothetical protein [Enterococcus faecium]|uniref:hypothetical protein n=1 Tax=Enterococcus faecium TaxID=1352 RepID=UPI00064C8F0A|nr:hypothetical protein [Enterococcus faecium]
MSDYLTAEQYEYARKTGDWESGKVLTHGQALNDNQQIVFDFLKNEFKRNDLQYTLWSFTEDVYKRLEIGVSSLPYVKAWGKLKEKQHFEVLAAFAQWGLEREEAE